MNSTPLDAITLPESKRLIALEKTIEAGQKTFVEVGVALTEIRDSKLYRSDFGTFEDYCKSKWGWERAQAYRLIEASAVKESIKMSPIGDKIKTESQARELSKVEPAKRVEVLQKVVESGRVTAKAIKEAAKEVATPTISQWEQGATSTPQPKETDPEDNDSDNLWNLKRNWRKASKKERAEFLNWVKKSGSK